jgi:DNA repair protein RecO (recombination protein O)
VPAYRATALVLRKTKLGEADTIVTMLDSEGRQIRAVAKGVRRSTSKIGARLEPFANVELLLHTGRTLHVVTEVSTVESNSRLREDFDRTVAASVVADVLDKSTADADAEPVLYDLALTTLQAMAEAPASAQPSLVAAFLLKATSLLGFRPTFSQCAKCGRDGASGFSVVHGGALCASCTETEGGSTHLSHSASSGLVSLMRARMSEVAGLELPADVRDELFRLMTAFAREHIPARLRSLEFASEQLAAATWPSVDPPATVG